MIDATKTENTSVESLLAEIVDEFIQRHDRDERPDIEEYAKKHGLLNG